MRGRGITRKKHTVRPGPAWAGCTKNNGRGMVNKGAHRFALGLESSGTLSHKPIGHILVPRDGMVEIYRVLWQVEQSRNTENREIYSNRKDWKKRVNEGKSWPHARPWAFNSRGNVTHIGGGILGVDARHAEASQFPRSCRGVFLICLVSPLPPALGDHIPRSASQNT